MLAPFHWRFVARVHASCCCKFDGTGGSIAHAFYPKSGALHFDDDEQYTNSNTTGYNLFSIALHEIGHLLGLKHSNDPKAVMYMEYKNNQNLTDEERHGIEYIYSEWDSFRSDRGEQGVTKALSGIHLRLALQRFFASEKVWDLGRTRRVGERYAN